MATTRLFLFFLFLSISNSVVIAETADEIWRSTLTEQKLNDLKSLQNTPELIEPYLINVNTFTYYEYLLVQTLVGIQIDLGNFQSAILIWKSYLDKFPSQKKDIQSIIEILESNQEKSNLTNMGIAINSEVSEYMPILELNDSRIYFTASNREMGKGSEDIWYSEKDEISNDWKPAVPLQELSSENPEAAVSISLDGNSMVLFGNFPGSRGGGDIFYSDLSKDGWTKVQPFPNPINSEYFDADLVYGPNRKIVLFSSDRPEGFFPYRKKGEFALGDYWGNTDLYVSFVGKNGEFSKPMSLGSTVNTPFSERTPYLHADGKTLYFSSNGHAGFGDLDIFKTVRLDDTWKNWSKPVNVGSILNGHSTDWGFKLNLSGNKGYFAGIRKDTFGETDIYEVYPLPLRAEPASSSLVLKGRLTNESGTNLKCNLQWKKKDFTEILGISKSKPTTGEYIISFPSGHIYILSISAEGYKTINLEFDATQLKSYKEIKRDITMTKDISPKIELIQKTDSKIYVPEEIYFDYKSYKIKKMYLSNLHQIVEIMVQDPSKSIIITGYSDDSGGSDTSDINLSGKRADEVSKYLVVFGIDPKRILSYGKGKLLNNNENIGKDSRIRKFSRKAILEFK
jgi:outer membrane protein OmpA-like peptidoglycan-associated protein